MSFFHQEISVTDDINNRVLNITRLFSEIKKELDEEEIKFRERKIKRLEVQNNIKDKLLDLEMKSKGFSRRKKIK
jgi:hypothetical protein